MYYPEVVFFHKSVSLHLYMYIQYPAGKLVYICRPIRPVFSLKFTLTAHKILKNTCGLENVNSWPRQFLPTLTLP